ncbi:MAG: hypothetical protein ACU0C9_13775 [Paracoccaceae bacterium]
MTRVIVHAGFHKTATSSLQDFLHQNRAELKPYFDYYGKADFHTAGAKARLYGQRPFRWRLGQFRRAFRRFLAEIPDTQTLVLSRETFAGVMPGHRDVFRRLVSGYASAAIPLAGEIVNEIQSRFGKDTKIQFLYTVREQEPWLRSVYGHLLRSIHLTDDFEAFRGCFDDLPDPEQDARAIATALDPTQVFIARLEDFTDHPEGPAAAVLDLVEVPDSIREKLHPANRKNQGQSPEIEQQFLMLNRSRKNKRLLKSMKEKILRIEGEI